MARITDITFRGKPIDALTREEAIEAVKQACAEVARLQGLPNFDYTPPTEAAYNSSFGVDPDKFFR